MKLDELKEALKEDFRNLYVPQYTTMWELERMVREGEIDIMPLTATLKLLGWRDERD